MKLEDILAIVSDYTTTKVIEYGTENVLGCYDGKNSIDPKYNKCQVINLFVGNEILHIVILNEKEGLSCSR